MDHSEKENEKKVSNSEIGTIPPNESNDEIALDSQVLKDGNTSITDDGDSFLDLLLQLEEKQAEIDELKKKCNSKNQTIKDLKKENNKLKHEKKELKKELQKMPTVELLLDSQNKLNYQLFEAE